MAIDKQDYLNLVTSQYQNSTNFLNWLSSLFGVVQDGTGLLEEMDNDFDLDYAVGVQLDVVGEIVGLSRYLNISILTSDVGFAWDNITLGWDTGIWIEDGATEVVSLDDETYRTALRVKIASNTWDGSISDAYASFKNVFSEDSIVLIQNNLDMSMELIIASPQSSLLLSYLFLYEYISFRPAGVKCNVHLNSLDIEYFAWDYEIDNLYAGWDIGYWSDGGYLVSSGGIVHSPEYIELEGSPEGSPWYLELEGSPTEGLEIE